jgi:predicted Zn-dependent protease
MDPQVKIDRFRALKEKMPTSELPRWTLAQAYEEANQPEDAEREYAELVALKPDYCMAWLRLGAVRLGLGRAVDARQPLEESIRLARAQGHEAPRMEASKLLAELEDDDD